MDNIIDLVFETQQEQDQKAQAIVELQDEAETFSSEKGTYAFTPKQELDAKRLQIVEKFFKDRKAQPIRKTKTNFVDSANKIAVTCAVSKRYKREYQPYWYALHPQ